jgi:hypothetical protein
MVPMDVYPLVMKAIDDIGNGRTLTRACDAAGLSVATFKRYVTDTPELHDLFNDAEQRGHDALADILLEIDSHPVYGSTDPKQQKVVSDNIKWFLARKRPQQYGDRVIVENKITADKAIIDALSRGAQRAIAAKVLEGVTYTVIDADAIDVDLLDFI